jgi:hypothetical protein
MRTHSISIASTLVLAGCTLFEDAKDKLDLDSEVSGRITDNRGDPVAGARLRLFDLQDNQDFVEGGDISSGEAFIDREAVLASTNSVESTVSDDDGELRIDGVVPGAFLASVTKDGCTAGFAGFDAERGVLSVDTLLVPEIANGLSFEIPEFVVACATPPEVGPEGNSDEAPPFEPELPDVLCDADACTSAGGTCDGERCAITCAAATCAESGGSCVDGACVSTVCDPSACESGGGSCNAADDTICDLPACSADADCDAAQPGAYCTDPGDVALATCNPPAAAEIIPPDEPAGWIGMRVADSGGTVLVDASADNQAIATTDVPSDGVLHVTAEYDGDASVGYLQVQSGGQSCPNLPPRTDYFPVSIVDGVVSSEEGPFVRLAALGGYQKIQLTTDAVLGEGDGSFVVEVGEPCAPPEFPFVATLSWDAGPGEPADLDLSVWNADGELVFVGNKQAAWGQLALDAKGPGPEVFVAEDADQGPFTVKVEFFSGKPRELEAKLRVQRTDGGQLIDDTFTFVVEHPKDVAEIGVFTATP